jgi:TolA-binding protein
MFNLGLSYSHLERHREAIEVFEKIAKEYPLSSNLIQRAEFEVANAMFNQGKVKDALKKFKIIIYKYPKTNICLQSISWLGQYYLKDKKFDLAVKYFKEIIDEFPDSASVDEAHYNLGKALMEMGNFSEATKELDRVSLQADKKLTLETKFAKADILSKSDASAAIKIYELALKEYPDFAKSTFVKLAKLYKNLNDLDKAISLFQSALTKSDDSILDTADVQIQFEIAELQELKGDLNRAIEAYLKIPYLYPAQNSWVVKSYLRVARIFEDKNDWREAKKIYEKLVAQDIEEAKFAQERLDWINKNLKN